MPETINTSQLQANDNGGWAEWHVFVLKELDRLSQTQAKMADVLLQMSKEHGDTKAELLSKLNKLFEEVTDRMSDACRGFEDRIDPVITRVTSLETAVASLRTRTKIVSGALGFIAGIVSIIAANVIAHLPAVIHVITHYLSHLPK